jgi:methionyl-tRNA synthetase
LDPTDLIDPKSTLSGSSNLEVRETRHLFLKLDKLQDKVEKWVNRQKWNKLTKSIAKKWLTEGLRERCITRDLNWGVEVKNPPFDPVSGDMLENADKTWPGFEDKVFYVWFDAPIGYISITWEWAKKTGNDWKKWWYDNEDDVEYYEFMGKDNIPFHSVFFPAMLIGTGENWTKVDQLKGSSWLTYEGGKFSKSEKRGIFCDEATSIYPADYWRYWLIANYPETDDVDFTMEKFKEVINKDLNDVLGNFVMRVAKFAKSKFDGKVPYEAQDSAVENEMKRELFRRISVYKKYFENLEFRKAMSELRAIWALGNEYINKAEPWVLMKESKEKAGNVINNGCQLIYIFAVLALPIIPEAAEKILNIFNINSKEALWIENEANYRKIKAGTEITIPDAIFTKI